jgi:hypothetical protein
MSSRVRGPDGSQTDLVTSAAQVSLGVLVSIPWWIFLPLLTPLVIIGAVLALARLEEYSRVESDRPG